MGLKEKLIAQEEGTLNNSENAQDAVLDMTQNDGLSLDIDLENVFAETTEEKNALNSETTMFSETPETNFEIEEVPDGLDYLKTDNKSEEKEEEPEVCPKCGGKRRRNGNYYHLKTCEDYKINGEYPNRKQAAEDSSDEFNLEEVEIEDKQETTHSTCLQNNLLVLAKRVILTDIQQNYTSKILTPDALNKLIEAYLSGDSTSISNEHQVFGAVLDEIISSKFQEEHYGDLTISVLEAIKADL